MFSCRAHMRELSNTFLWTKHWKVQKSAFFFHFLSFLSIQTDPWPTWSSIIQFVHCFKDNLAVLFGQGTSLCSSSIKNRIHRYAHIMEYWHMENEWNFLMVLNLRGRQSNMFSCVVLHDYSTSNTSCNIASPFCDYCLMAEQILCGFATEIVYASYWRINLLV